MIMGVTIKVGVYLFNFVYDYLKSIGKIYKIIYMFIYVLLNFNQLYKIELSGYIKI